MVSNLIELVDNDDKFEAIEAPRIINFYEGPYMEEEKKEEIRRNAFMDADAYRAGERRLLSKERKLWGQAVQYYIKRK